MADDAPVRIVTDGPGGTVTFTYDTATALARVSAVESLILGRDRWWFGVKAATAETWRTEPEADTPHIVEGE